MHRSALPFFTAVFLGTATAVAQTAGEPVVRLEPLTVTAHPSGADERTASVWVVAPDPTGPAPSNVGSLLLEVPGGQFDQPGGPGGRSTLYLRGGEENHTVVFLDGVPLNDPTNARGGGVDLTTLEVQLLRSAAVVRGPASVRYGPETLAGVVHFGSGAIPDDRADASAEAGGDGLRRGAFTIGSKRVGADTGVCLSAAATDEGSLADGSAARRRFVHASVTMGDPVRFTLTAWRATLVADSFPDDSGGKHLAVLRDLEHRTNEQTVVAARASGHRGEGTWTLTADAAQFDSTTDSPGVAPGWRDPMGVPASTDDSRLRRYRASAAVERPLAGWRINAGLDAQREQGRSESTLRYGPMVLPASFAAERSRLGLFAEGSGPIGGATAVVGARADHYSDGLTRGTVRAGLLGPLVGRTQWRVNAGTGFKPPSFYALANPLVGNPDLKPERAVTVDVGVRHPFAGAQGLLDLTVFSSRFRDGIDFDPGPPPRMVNRAGIRSRGAEAAFTWRPGTAFSLGGSLTYTDARSQPGDEPMRSRPQWRGGLSATWQAQPGLALQAAVVSVGRVPDTSIPSGAVWLGGWTRLDLAASWQAVDRAGLSLAVDNVLNRTCQQAVGVPSPGRRLRAGLRLRF